MIAILHVIQTFDISIFDKLIWKFNTYGQATFFVKSWPKALMVDKNKMKYVLRHDFMLDNWIFCSCKSGQFTIHWLVFSLVGCIFPYFHLVVRSGSLQSKGRAQREWFVEFQFVFSNLQTGFQEWEIAKTKLGHLLFLQLWQWDWKIRGQKFP